MFIALSDDAPPALLIPDPTGEEHAYGMTPLALSPGWGVLLTRLDTGDAYRVTAGAAGGWSCECRAQQFRRRGAPPCKHIRAGRQLRAFLRSFGVGESCLAPVGRV